MTTKPAKPRKNRAPLNLAMGVLGLAGIGATIVSYAAELPSPAFGLSMLVVAISLITMYFTRKSDEYTFSLWSSATNGAFAMILFWMLAAPAIEGFIDGLFGIENGQDFPSDLAAIASVLTFYATFNIKRLTGAL